MGLFSKQSKDYFLEKYGGVDLTKDKKALIQVYSDRGLASEKALFILKSFLCLDDETYNNCKRGFKKNDEFWEEWLKCISLDTLVESMDESTRFPFLQFLKEDYESEQILRIFIDFTNGQFLHSANQMIRLFNFCNELINHGFFPQDFIHQSVVYRRLGMGEPIDKLDHFLLEYEMYNEGLNQEQRNSLFYADYSLLPFEVVKINYQEYKDAHPQSKSMNLEEFQNMQEE